MSMYVRTYVHVYYYGANGSVKYYLVWYQMVAKTYVHVVYHGADNAHELPRCT